MFEHESSVQKLYHNNNNDMVSQQYESFVSQGPFYLRRLSQNEFTDMVSPLYESLNAGKDYSSL